MVIRSINQTCGMKRYKCYGKNEFLESRKENGHSKEFLRVLICWGNLTLWVYKLQVKQFKYENIFIHITDIYIYFKCAYIFKFLTF